MMQRSREKEQIQQHIKGTENFLLKAYTVTGVGNYDLKSSGKPEAALHGISYVLEDSSMQFYVFTKTEKIERRFSRMKYRFIATYRFNKLIFLAREIDFSSNRTQIAIPSWESSFAIHFPRLLDKLCKRRSG
ncbi:hypothetical protein TNCV_3705191 [Trichonephila clavipes]|nr:hypothetical protein TNCV_3705191 [Trichonephila clavipes]